MAKICSICAKSDILCSGCSMLLADGAISEWDIAVARALAQLNVAADFIRCVDTPSTLIIVAGRDAGRIIGRGGKNAGKIEKLVGRPIDIVEEGDEKEMIGKLLRVPVVGINKVYGAAERYKIRVEKRYKNRIRREPAVISLVLGKQISIVFE